MITFIYCYSYKRKSRRLFHFGFIYIYFYFVSCVSCTYFLNFFINIRRLSLKDDLKSKTWYVFLDSHRKINFKLITRQVIIDYLYIYIYWYISILLIIVLKMLIILFFFSPQDIGGWNIDLSSFTDHRTPDRWNFLDKLREIDARTLSLRV